MNTERPETNESINYLWGFTVRYLFRFIHIPYLLAVFFITLFVATTLSHSEQLQGTLAGILIWPLVGIFRYPTEYSSTSLAPLLLVTSFWLLVIHLFIEVGSRVLRRPQNKASNTQNRLGYYIIWIGYAAALMTLLFANNVQSKTDFLVFLTVAALAGHGSFWLGQRVLAISKWKITW